MTTTRTVSSSVSVTRRGFLRLGAGSVAAWTWAAGGSIAGPAEDFRCIFINLVGGPSHLDSWDPKPHAPSEYRGPFQPIRTKVPGIHVTELFPKLASIMDRVALVRSVFHEEAPIHEAGFQLLQTGRLAQAEHGAPHVGQLVSAASGQQTSPLIPRPIENTGVQISHGQEGLVPVRILSDPVPDLDRMGQHHFGRSCQMALHLVERGARFVTVNMFDSVYDTLSWDCHRDGGRLNVGLEDYRSRLAPMFDQAYTALILELELRGLLKQTMVVAAGEFGRSPKINLRGGRDHWAGAWTVLFAGGGVRGGQVIGRTDRFGSEPIECPVHASAIANTILDAAGLPWRAHYRHGEPVRELIGRVPV